MPGLDHRHRILIIDDEQSIADTLVIVFSRQGYETKAVYSAEEAIELIAGWRPDVAIIDVMLPQMNGIDFAIVLKSNYPDCRPILFSGSPATADVAAHAAKQGHFFEIIAKPVHPMFLLNAVADLLRPSQDLVN